jgi:hypothetical protein
VQALLAFGFGLEAMDAGNHADAARHFARATQLDPAFDRARQLQSRSEEQSAAAGTAGLAQIVATTFDLELTDWQRRRLGIEALGAAVPDPQPRDPVVEVLGTEGLGRGRFIDIVIRRPGGGS